MVRSIRSDFWSCDVSFACCSALHVCAGVNLGSMRRIVLHAKDFSWDGSWSSAPWPELRLGISMLARGEEVTTIALCAGSIGPSHGFWLRAADLTHNFWREGKSGDSVE